MLPVGNLNIQLAYKYEGFLVVGNIGTPPGLLKNVENRDWPLEIV
jgi:hypothetical protein